MNMEHIVDGAANVHALTIVNSIKDVSLEYLGPTVEPLVCMYQAMETIHTGVRDDQSEDELKSWYDIPVQCFPKKYFNDGHLQRRLSPQMEERSGLGHSDSHCLEVDTSEAEQGGKCCKSSVNPIDPNCEIVVLIPRDFAVAQRSQGKP